MAASFAGSLAARRDSAMSIHWKCSISSAASIASDMLRFLGEWNCCQSRSATKRATRSRRSARVVEESGMGGARGTGDRGQRTGDRGQGTEDRGQGSEDRGQRTGDRGQRTEETLHSPLTYSPLTG